MRAQADSFRQIRILLNTTFIDYPDRDLSLASGGGNKSCTHVGQLLPISALARNPADLQHNCMNGTNVQYIDNCYIECRPEDVVTPQMSAALRGNLSAIKTFFEDWLMVQDFPYYPNIFTDSMCGDLILTNQSIPQDVVIYLTLRPMPFAPGTLAFANPCFLHPISSRPIAMHVNVQPTTMRSNSDIITVLRHELVHGFGFSADMYRFYRHPSDRTKTYYEYNSSTFPRGPVKSNNQSAIVMDNENGRFGPKVNGTYLGPGNNIKLITPNVVAFGRSYFGCPTLDGVELENDGTSSSVATHWESRILYWETMTAVQKAIPGKFTGFTTALMKDMGFYEVRSGYVPDAMDFGFGRGCSFTNDLCNTTNRVGTVDIRSWYFCDSSSSDFCGYNSHYLGKCNLLDYVPGAIPPAYQYFPEYSGRAGSDEFTNRCPMAIAYSDGFCTQRSVVVSDYNPFKETNGSSTRCHRSGVIDNRYVIDGGTSVVRCFKTVCVNKQKTMVRLGDYMFPCAANTAVQFLGPAATDKNPPVTNVYIRSNDFTGIFTCSDPSMMCDGSLASLNADMLQSSTWPSITQLSPSNLTITGKETMYIFGANLTNCVGAEVGEAPVTDFKVWNNSCVSFTSEPVDTVTGGPGKSGSGNVYLKLKCKVTGCEQDGCFVAYAPLLLYIDESGGDAADTLSEFFGTLAGKIVLGVIGLLVLIGLAVLIKAMFCTKNEHFDEDDDDSYNISTNSKKPLESEMQDML